MERDVPLLIASSVEDESGKEKARDSIRYEIGEAMDFMNATTRYGLGQPVYHIYKQVWKVSNTSLGRAAMYTWCSK